jgi:hypothetical protein
VLALREGGSSFSAIARSVELHRAVSATEASYGPSVRMPATIRQQLVKSEEERLDQLEQRIRITDAAHPEKVRRRLVGVGELRGALRR